MHSLACWKVAGSDHHAVNVLGSQHLLGVLVRPRFQVENLLDVGRAILASQAPEVANRDSLNGKLLGSKLGHMHMTAAAITAAKLSQANTIVRSQDARI